MLERSLLTLMLAIAASSAAAAEPVLIFEGTSRDLYIDVQSVKVRSGYVSAWYLGNLRERGGNGELSSVTLKRIHCDAEASSNFSSTAYAEANGRGAVLVSYTLKPHEVEMTPQAPGSAGYEAIAVACHIHKHGSLEGYNLRP